MIAYPKNDLDNVKILQEVKKWHNNKLISDAKFQELELKYKHQLYSPNFFIRIGLFVFTFICASAANGFLMAVTGMFDGSEYGMGLRFFIHAAIMLFALEFFIKEKKPYKSGLDDALLYMSLGFISTALSMIFYSYERGEGISMLLISIMMLPFLISATIRYADMLVALAAFICGAMILFLALTNSGDFTKPFLPFAALVFAASFYFLTLKYKKIEKLRYWESCFWIIEIASLVLFYLAGNYYVVRNLTEELLGVYLKEGEDIPLAIFFYAFTATIPLVYVYFGLKNKNKSLLNTGLLLIAAAVFTFKYYFSLGHHEISMTAGGIILIAVAWLSINYLKKPKHGITYAEDKDENLLGNFDSETLLIAQSFGSQHNQVENNPQTGGGKFGGGGADGGF